MLSSYFLFFQELFESSLEFFGKHDFTKPSKRKENDDILTLCDNHNVLVENLMDTISGQLKVNAVIMN